MVKNKKILLYFLLAIYAMVLVHNLTPHVHGADLATQKEDNFLSSWFELLFGSEHHENEDSDHHFSVFRIEEENSNEIFSFEISDNDSEDNCLFFYTSHLNLSKLFVQYQTVIPYPDFKNKFFAFEPIVQFIGKAPPAISLM